MARHGVVHGGGALIGLCGIAVLWAGMLHALSVERDMALRDAIQNTSNLARAFEEHIVRTMKTVDRTLLFVREAHRQDPDHFDLNAWTSGTMKLTDLASQVALVNRDGILVDTNFLAPPNTIDLSDREHLFASNLH